MSEEPRTINGDAVPDPAGAPPSGGSAAGSDGRPETQEPPQSPLPQAAEEAPETPVTGAELGLALPDDPHEARAILLRELAEARQEAGEHLETMQRIAADFDNFRRRVQRDQVENVERASQRVIESLLPTLDSLDAALVYDATTPGEARLLDGMRSTHDQLIETLARVGFEPIPTAGEVFDPKVHEAVSGPAEEGEGELLIDNELRRGYVMHGRVIRPSLVTVTHA